MGGSSPPPANTTQTTQQNPWAGAMPYLQGKAGHAGIFPEAERFYQQNSQLSPQQSGLNDYYSNALENRYQNINQFDLGRQFLNGEYDPTAGMTNGRQSTMTGAHSFTTDQRQNMAALGGNDPSQAIGQMLTGQPDNPYLSSLHQANINQSMRGYDDAIRNLQTSVLPQIGDQAFAAGGYGGSRQGVAEGMALEQMQRNARDLGIAAMDSGNQLYGSAYESAQGRKADMANMMNNTAAQMGQFNAGQKQNAAQYNADALNNIRMFNAGQLQNADQFNANLDMQQQAARAGNALQGKDIYKDVYASQDNIFNQLQSIYGAPTAQWQNALNQFAGVISPGATFGGNTTQTNQVPIYSNNASQLLGGASSIAGLLSSMGK
jgi:hypothetical protein